MLGNSGCRVGRQHDRSCIHALPVTRSLLQRYDMHLGPLSWPPVSIAATHTAQRRSAQRSWYWVSFRYTAPKWGSARLQRLRCWPWTGAGPTDGAPATNELLTRQRLWRDHVAPWLLYLRTKCLIRHVAKFSQRSAWSWSVLAWLGASGPCASFIRASPGVTAGRALRASEIVPSARPS